MTETHFLGFEYVQGSTWVQPDSGSDPGARSLSAASGGCGGQGLRKLLSSAFAHARGIAVETSYPERRSSRSLSRTNTVISAFHNGVPALGLRLIRSRP